MVTARHVTILVECSCVTYTYMYVHMYYRCTCIYISVLFFVCAAIIVGFQSPEYTFLESTPGGAPVFVIKSATVNDVFTVDVSASKTSHVYCLIFLLISPFILRNCSDLLINPLPAPHYLLSLLQMYHLTLHSYSSQLLKIY